MEKDYRFNDTERFKASVLFAVDCYIAANEISDYDYSFFDDGDYLAVFAGKKQFRKHLVKILNPIKLGEWLASLDME